MLYFRCAKMKLKNTIFYSCCVFSMALRGQDILTESYNNLSKSKTESEKMEALLNLSAYYCSNNFDSSFYYSERVLDLLKKKDNQSKLATCYKNISMAYYYKPDYDKALIYALKSSDILEKINNNSSEFAFSLQQIGSISHTDSRRSVTKSPVS